MVDHMEKSKEKIDISVIIPAKNEEKRLPVFFAQLIDCISRSRYIYEIIVVNDGSTDKTADYVLSLSKQYAFIKLLNLEENKGKGFAVRQGFYQAQGRVRLFLDADGSTPPQEIEKNLSYLWEGYDVVIGSRMKKSQEVIREKKFVRKAIGIVFNFFVHTFLFKDIEDSQCGFKMFREECVKPLFEQMHIHGFGFDMEILYLAQKSGYQIKEVPVNWRHVSGSKVNVFCDALKMFVNMLQIRKWHRK